MSYGLNTLGPKASQQGTRALSNTHGKMPPAQATARGTQSVAPAARSERAYQAPEMAGNDPADSVSPGPLAR